MKRVYFSIIICMLFAGNIFASDDLYDLYYGRPSFFPDFTASTAYANNMNYIVVAKSTDGQYIENYEVAVYDQNNELRAIGRSQVNSNDICMLSICGIEGDSFRFEVLYGDIVKPTVMKAQETCQFQTNDIVGLDTPFVLTVNDTCKSASVCYTLSDVPYGEFRIVCLPYAVDCINGTAYEICGYESGVGVYLVPVETMEAGKPYFVTSSGTGDIEFIYHNIAAGATTKVSDPISNNGLIGTFDDNIDVPDGMYILSANQLCKFDPTTVPDAINAYVDISQIVNSSSADNRILLGFYENEDAVHTVSSDTSTVTSVYLMDGTKRASVSHGINIIRMSDGNVGKRIIQ